MKEAQQISQIVANHYGLFEKSIHTSIRKSKYVRARQISMFIMRELTGMSLVDIASYYERNHATAIYSINIVKDNISKSKTYKRDVLKLIEKCKKIDLKAKCNPCSVSFFYDE